MKLNLMRFVKLSITFLCNYFDIFIFILVKTFFSLLAIESNFIVEKQKKKLNFYYLFI